MANNYGHLLDYNRGTDETDAALSLCALGGYPISPNIVKTPAPLEPLVCTISGILRGRQLQAIKKKQQTGATPGEYTKDPRHYTSVSFDEMKRLIHLYGPIKGRKSRVTRVSATPVRPESIRRKFHRWFPDFAERFKKTPYGWYSPKAGHRQEMDYREVLRNMSRKKNCNRSLGSNVPNSA